MKVIGTKVVYGPFRVVFDKKGKGLCRSPCVDTKKREQPMEMAGDSLEDGQVHCIRKIGVDEGSACSCG